jgi:hypothetical protein
MMTNTNRVEILPINGTTIDHVANETGTLVRTYTVYGRQVADVRIGGYVYQVAACRVVSL